MKNTKVTLVPLAADDREQFILDNQWAFKHGALMEFGERDDHLDADGEIISRATIETSNRNWCCSIKSCSNPWYCSWHLCRSYHRNDFPERCVLIWSNS